MNTFEKAEIAAAYLHTRTAIEPKIGIVLGSGLGSIVENLENKTSVPFTMIPYFFDRKTPDDPGFIHFGILSGIPVALITGRYHFYEGIPLAEIGFPIRVLKLLGIDSLLITNACGAINTKFAPGDLMLITDHLNMVGNNPLIGKNEDSFGPRFADASEIYAQELREIAHEVATDQKLPLREGVYAWWSGPSYETPAEIRMLRSLGADAVGMSTVPEALTASHMAMKVLGISCLTNMATGIRFTRLSHEEVLEVAAKTSEKFMRFIREIVKRI